MAAALPPSDGILFVCFQLPHARKVVVRELISAARLLRRTLRPAPPIEVLANDAASLSIDHLLPRTAPRPWQYQRLLTLGDRMPRPRFATTDVRYAYLHKLAGLAQTRFNRTLYLDCDVHVIAPSFAHDLLAHALAVADVAMPLDPGRAAHLVPAESAGAGSATRTAAPWVAPAVGPPMLCSAVLAFRSNAHTHALFVGAARRLVEHAHPGVRQGDQYGHHGFDH
jgi:hypothetical protein